MPQWEEEEGLLPRSLESRKVTDLNSFKREPEGFRILCERSRRVPIKGARELIQNNDECQPRAWPLRPVIQFAARRTLQKQGKSFANRRIRTTAEPPLKLADHPRVVCGPQLGKPKPENVFEFLSLHRSIHPLARRPTLSHSAAIEEPWSKMAVQHRLKRVRCQPYL